MKVYRIQYSKAKKWFHLFSIIWFFTVIFLMVFANIYFWFTIPFLESSFFVLAVLEILAFLFGIYEIISGSKAKIVLYENYVRIFYIRWTIFGKLYIKDFTKISAEKNTIINDKKFDANSVIVDLVYINKEIRVALLAEDYFDFIESAHLKGKVVHSPILWLKQLNA